MKSPEPSRRPDEEQGRTGPTARWWQSVFFQAALGSLLLFAALPPISAWPLGWIAPVPWLLLVRRERLVGRRPYVQIWLAGVLFWLLAAHWLRLPHPATSAGWIAVALYLGCYLPAFVALSRVGVHLLKLPLWIAAPVVWTGLELLRAHLLTGFLMASIAHTQVSWPAVLQVADLGGEYVVHFVMLLVAVCVAEIWWVIRRPGDAAAGTRRPLTGLIGNAFIAAAVLAATLVYGYWRLAEDAQRPGPRVALIQGNSLAEWKADPDRAQRIMDEYTQVSLDAVRAARESEDGRPVDLVVWPETMFRGSIVTFETGYVPPAENSKLEPEAISGSRPAQIAALASLLETPVLLGIDVVRHLADPPDGSPRYLAWNSAVLAERDGTIVGLYSKVHLVIFGEYVPFAEYFPWLYRLTPLPGGVTPGEGSVALESGGVTYAPNICYESVLPHVIRRQVVELTRARTPPDVLVNLTNDAWYWGSSELDMHLACDVLRAIEMRRPHLVAANGGISAHMDSCGRILDQSPRQQPDFILADVALDSRTSLYRQIGDWPAGVCLAVCVMLAIAGAVRRISHAG